MNENFDRRARSNTRKQHHHQQCCHFVKWLIDASSCGGWMKGGRTIKQRFVLAYGMPICRESNKRLSVDRQLSQTTDVFSSLLSLSKMYGVRKNTLVIDFTVLPIRPEVKKVQEFLEDEIKLQYADVKSIQLHHSRNCVLVEMKSYDIAARYQLENNWKRTMLCVGKEFRIPVYVDCEAVTVWVHDLLPSMSHSTVGGHMLKYGEVISIRSETWKHYFSGIKNGVRVLRMRLLGLLRDIPPFIIIEDEKTMVSYPNQPKPDPASGQPAQSREQCLASHSANSNQLSTPKSTPLPADESLNPANFPSLIDESSSSSPVVGVPNTEEQNNDGCSDEDNASSTSSDFTEVANKRRRSTKQQEKIVKKVCADQGSHNAATLN